MMAELRLIEDLGQIIQLGQFYAGLPPAWYITSQMLQNQLITFSTLFSKRK